MKNKTLMMFVFLITSFQAFSNTFEGIIVDDYMASADLIIKGTLIDQSSKINPDLDKIITSYTFNIQDTIKGTIKSKTIVVDVLGGCDDQSGQCDEYSFEYKYKYGQQDFVFINFDKNTKSYISTQDFIVNNLGATSLNKKGTKPISTNINWPPFANFFYSCANLTCYFNANGSYDQDGYIIEYFWWLGEAGIQYGFAPVVNFYNYGPHWVTLQVTDNEFAIGSFSTIVYIQSPPAADDYDDISLRGYNDNNPGDAEPLYRDEIQEHNFHTSGDTDWVIFAMPSGGGNEISTEQLGDAYAKLTAYRVNGFPSETSPGSGRWNIALNQLIEIDRDHSSGNNSVVLHNTTSELQAYVVKITGSTHGYNTQYSLSSLQNDPVITPDDYDNISVRGYTDDSPGDAEPLSRNQSQIHNFHNTGDVDWIIFAMGSGSGNEISTTQIGLASAGLIAYQVDGFPAETSPGSRRWVIPLNQLIEIDRDTSSGNNSVVLQNTTGEIQAYVVKVMSSGSFGYDTEYSISSSENNP